MHHRHVIGLVCIGVAAFIVPSLVARTGGTEQTWQAVKTWSGKGTKETETFEVGSREWRIAWEATGKDPSLGRLSVSVYNDKDQPVSMVGGKPGKDVTYVRGAGRYYLKISSANVEWSVTVEEQR